MSTMSLTRRQTVLCTLYALISLAALVGTASQLKPYLPLGFVNANIHFWQDTLVNAASRFITVDIMFVFLVCWHWMLTEARRLKMRAYGWYFPASLFIAFSATLPIFMLHRELARPADEARAADRLGLLDWLSVVLVAAVALGYTWRAITMA